MAESSHLEVGEGERLEFNGDPIGPQRVWLKTENIPGLAMSRSVGDKVAHSVGVSSDPGREAEVIQK